MNIAETKARDFILSQIAQLRIYCQNSKKWQQLQLRIIPESTVVLDGRFTTISTRRPRGAPFPRALRGFCPINPAKVGLPRNAWTPLTLCGNDVISLGIPSRVLKNVLLSPRAAHTNKTRIDVIIFILKMT